MRSPAVACLVLVLVVGLAVSGSRAEPMMGAKSVAFAQCEGATRALDDNPRCAPLLRAASTEFDFDRIDYSANDATGGWTAEAGGDYDPDRINWQLVVQLLLVALDFIVNNWNNWLTGGVAAAETTPPLLATLFDPLR